MDHPARPTSALPATAITTGAPTTGAPTTGAPTTGAPTTGAPTTGAPTTGARTAVAPPGAPPGAVRSGAAPRSLGGDLGMATAEYAIATLAACGFAGLLVAVLSSDEVRGLLMGVIQRALSTV